MNNEFQVWEVYSVTPKNERVVIVDFLRETGGGRHRVTRCFFKEDWEEIERTRTYLPCQEFDDY